jgi:hypothetical protein
MLKSDILSIEILDDGTIRTTTDVVSGANHANAEQFLKYLATLAGGDTVRVKRTDAHAHGHSHSHSHDEAHDHEHN